MSNLKEQLIRLGSTNPELQEHLRPILDILKREAGSFVKQLDYRKLEQAAKETEHLLDLLTRLDRVVDRKARSHVSAALDATEDYFHVLQAAIDTKNPMGVVDNRLGDRHFKAKTQLLATVPGLRFMVENHVPESELSLLFSIEKKVDSISRMKYHR